MPHVTFEYSANIEAECDWPALLEKVNTAMIAQGGVFPTGGIRSRAIRLDYWRMADGQEDDAFVHGTLKMGAGRDDATRRRAGEAVFEAMKAHFADLYARRYLGLSLEIHEFAKGGTWTHNNVHARFAR